VNKWLRGVLPKSRKARVILAIFIVCALALIAYLFSGRKSRTSNDFELAQRAARQAQIEALNRDSDKDGLKDWEEMIFHTDPHNPDTDGDGTPDGEEVRLGRDPLKPNTSKDPLHPNDLMATSTPLADNGSDLGRDGINLTSDFTRTFLRQPVTQILMGEQGNFDTKGVNQYTTQLMGKSVLADAPRFTIKDIRINPATNQRIVTQYLTSFKEIFDTLATRGDNELQIVSEVFQTQEYGRLTDLADYPDAYQKAINDLRKLPAPKGFVDFHLTVINDLSKFKRSNELFQKIETDPILGMLAVQERLKLNDEFNSLVHKGLIAALQK